MAEGCADLWIHYYDNAGQAYIYDILTGETFGNSNRLFACLHDELPYLKYICDLRVMVLHIIILRYLMRMNLFWTWGNDRFGRMETHHRKPFFIIVDELAIVTIRAEDNFRLCADSTSL